jgi:hypothetical protein
MPSWKYVEPPILTDGLYKRPQPIDFIITNSYRLSHASNQSNDTLKLKHGAPILRRQSCKAVARKQWKLDFLLSVCPLIEPLNGRQEVLKFSLATDRTTFSCLDKL